MSKHPVEILKDIVEYYKTNPRGVDTDNAGCIYAGCAVGFACGFQVDGWDGYESGGEIVEIYFEQYGFLKGLKTKEEPSKDLCLFEMSMYKDFIDNVFKGDYEEALINIYSDFDCLSSEKIPKKDLVWKIRSKNQYKAYEEGEIIRFYSDKNFVKGIFSKFVRKHS